MKQFKSFGLVVVTLLFSVTMAFAAKPNMSGTLLPSPFIGV